MFRYVLFFLFTLAACKAPHETDAYLAARLRKARRNPKVYSNSGGAYRVLPKLSKYNPDTGVVKMEYQSVEAILEKGEKDQRNGRGLKHSDLPLGGRIILYVVERPAQVAIPKRWELSLTIAGTTKPLQTKKQYRKCAQNNPIVGSMVQFIYTIPVHSPLTAPITVLLKDRATKANYSFKLSHGKGTRAAAAKAVRTIRRVALTQEKPFMKSLT